MTTPSASRQPAHELGWLDALPADEAERELRTCCASTAWARAVVAGRPYRDIDRLLAAADGAFAGLTETDIDEALAAHPRIGERATGPGREAGWSRQEQSGAASADDATKSALETGNRAYEERFGQVFLICATGLTADQMLAALHARLDHDAVTERRVLRQELAKIARLRLERLLTR